MERPNVRNLVTATLAQHLNKPEHGLNEEQDIFEDLGADSLDVVELTLIFEETFHVEIPDSDVEQLHTVGDIVNLLHKKVSENMITEQEVQKPGEDENELEGGEGAEDVVLTDQQDEESGEGDEEGEGSEEE